MESKRFISILSDYGFKVTFADESDTYFLRRALKALIQSKEEIKKVQFLRNEFAALTKDSRGGLYDLICEDEKGNTFIVEMQLGSYKNYIHRSKFYAFQKFNTFVEKGKYRFNNLPKIYCIGFLAKNIYPNLETYYHYGTLKNEGGEELDSQITHIIIEISKFNKKEKEIQTDLDKLIFAMKYLDTYQHLNELPTSLSEDWLDKITEKIDKSTMTSEQRMYFEMFLAKNVSRIEMLKEEIRQEIAKEQARGEKNANRNIAKKLKKYDIAYDILSKATGLSIEEIEAL